MLSYEFCEIFKNTFFYRTPVAASLLIILGQKINRLLLKKSHRITEKSLNIERILNNLKIEIGKYIIAHADRAEYPLEKWDLFNASLSSFYL